MKDEELCHLIKEEVDKNIDRIEYDVSNLFNLHNNQDIRLNEHAIEINTMKIESDNNNKTTKKLSEVVSKLDNTLKRIETEFIIDREERKSDKKSIKFFAYGMLIIYSIMSYGLEKTINSISKLLLGV